MVNKIVILILIHFCFLGFSQEENRVDIDESSNYIINKESLKDFYDKLESDESTTILHIGDSHIQANAFTGRLRNLFQSEYGKSSRGIVFPLRLTKTNGHRDVQFTSNIRWDYFNITNPKKGKECGLAGATIQTTKPKFYIQLKNIDSLEVNSIKIIGKGLEKLKFGIPNKPIPQPKITYNSTTYRVKKGDYLGKIARKFKTSVSNLKRWNNLRSDRIDINQKLKINKGGTAYKPQKIDLANFDLIQASLTSDEEIILDFTTNPKNLYIISDENTSKSFTRIDGFFLENYNKGVVYHSIGINGAKYIDYNKSDLFFEQLDNINPDLIILSMGTNESFYNTITPNNFKENVSSFLDKIKEHTSCENILLTTPPTSFRKRRYQNKKLKKLSDVLIDVAGEKNYALWNLFELTGEENGVKEWYRKGLMAKDRIHYSALGYQIQANKLFEILKPTTKEIETKKIVENETSNN